MNVNYYFLLKLDIDTAATIETIFQVLSERRLSEGKGKCMNLMHSFIFIMFLYLFKSIKIYRGSTKEFHISVHG